MTGVQSDKQARLLEVVLAEDSQVLAAWERWKKVGDLDELDGDSFAVLPLLYPRLRGERGRDASIAKLGSVYRQATYRNQLMAARLAALLSGLDAAAIQVVILSGVALSEFYYAQSGVRPFQVAQIAVKEADLRAARGVLERCGWRQQSSSTYRALRLGACDRYRLEPGFDVDLCGRIFLESGHAAIDRQFRDATRRVEFRGAPARILEPHAQLILLCVRSLASLGDTSLLWIVDAAQILAHEGDRLDLPGLLTLAGSSCTVVHLRERLKLVQEWVSSSLVEGLIRQLDKVPISEREVREFQLMGKGAGGLGRFPWLWNNYVLRVEGSTPAVLRPVKFITYARDTFGLQSVLQLPYALARKVVARLLNCVA